MAHCGSLSCLSIVLLLSPGILAVTCPGFPGYCSESFPGMSCNVVCSRGRNNVPLCQEDGTWTDIPRCIEHDPGVVQQIAGLCPGVPGYCSTAFYDGRCNFNCPNGPDINSVCTHDGTWDPYPTCQGDIRETQDGCNGCPGPNGDKRNRTAEAILAEQASRENNEISHNRVPKVGSIDSRVNINSPINNRQTVPSFAGNVKFGKIDASKQRNTGAKKGVPAIQKIQQQQLPRQQQQQPTQQTFSQRRPTQQQFSRQQQQQPTQQTFSQRRPTQQQFPRQQQQQPTKQQFPRQQQPSQQQFARQQPSQQRRPTQQDQVFNQIRDRITQRQRATDPPARPTPPTRQIPQSRPIQARPELTQSRPFQAQPRPELTQSRPVQAQPRPELTQSRPVQTQSRPVQTQSRPIQSRPPPPQSRPVQGRGPQPSASTPLDQTFGPFQSVDLSNALGGVAPTRSEPRSQPLRARPVQRQDEDGFFGVFEEVQLQG